MLFFAAGIGLLACSCDADEQAMQNPETNAATVADFQLTNPGEIVKEGTYLNLVNTSQNAKSFLWDFGDGTTSTEASPQHKHDRCGTYTVKLTVTDASGETFTTEKAVDVFCTVPRHRANPMVYSRN